MIRLATNNQTTVQYLSGESVESSTTTDHLYVESVSIDFSTGALYATVARGTVNAQGVFESNYPSVSITVNPDGSFVSSDNKWVGNLGGAVASIISQLASTFDEFVLAAGLVQGTVESDQGGS